jgi:MraZ protein
VFRGAHSINLDSKGRVAIPTRYRQSLLDDCAGQMVCTVHNIDPCLLLYPLPAWELVQQKLRQMPSTHPRAARLHRLLVGYANDGDMDKNGRFLLPAPLRAHASLTKQVMLVGQTNHLAIWDAERWQQQVLLDIDAEQQESDDPDEFVQGFSLT